MRTAASNSTYPKVAVHWLIEVLYFYFTFVLAENLALLNARHRQVPKRQTPVELDSLFMGQVSENFEF